MVDVKTVPALGYLPPRLAESAKRTAALYDAPVEEIRLRKGQRLALTIDGKNVTADAVCTGQEIAETVMSLCRHSVYAHENTIREGYIAAEGGIRAGVCGRAVTSGGMVTALSEITSVSIRIPHRVPGAGDEVLRLLRESGFRKNILIYSPPGVGKTTVLREVIYGIRSRRLAVVDTRYELYTEEDGELMADILGGYPRAKGIEIALRTLSPELIVCDEIGSREDAAAITDGLRAGVPLLVSAHAGSYDELCEKENLASLIADSAFPVTVGLLSRDGNGYRYEIREKQT